MQLVLVVLPSKGTALYTEVKQAALQRGIVTQCVAAPQAKIQGDAASKDVPYLNNLLLKINAKLVRLRSLAVCAVYVFLCLCFAMLCLQYPPSTTASPETAVKPTQVLNHHIHWTGGTPT